MGIIFRLEDPMKLAATFLAVTMLLLAGGATLGGQEARQTAQLELGIGRVPSEAISLENPYAGQGEAVLAGRKLFRRHCAACHGAEGRGQDKAPDLHSRVIQRVTPGTLFWFLKNGNLKQGMPPWSRLPDQRLWQIVTYLKTLS